MVRISCSALTLALLVQLAHGQPFPAELPLASLLPENGGDGSVGSVILGGNRNFLANDGALASAGDVNGDGIPDLVIGVPDFDTDFNSVGAAYVVFGRPGGFPPEFRVTDLQPEGGGDGSLGFVIVGGVEFGDLGASVSAGDINGDGLSDVIASQRGGPSRDSFVYVIYGRDTGIEGNFPARISAEALLPANGGDGSLGVVLAGGIDLDMGLTVSSGGDLNGDGRDDIAISGELFNTQLAYVIYGWPDDDPLPTLFDVQNLRPPLGGDGSVGFITASFDFDAFSIVALGGDIDGDGLGDLLVGSEAATPQNRIRAGIVVSLAGRDAMAGERFRALELLDRLKRGAGGDGSDGFFMAGTDADDNAGESIAFIGDVNGDGIEDLMIGTEEGARAYVVYGRDAATEGNFPPQFPLATVAQSPAPGEPAVGFSVEPARIAHVRGAGDINGDGVDDLIIGTVDAFSRSAAYVVYGRDTAAQGEFTPRFSLEALQPAQGGDGSEGFVIRGVGAGDETGESLAGIGDVNGDGIDDVAVAAPGFDSGNAQTSDGAVFVIYGRTE